MGAGKDAWGLTGTEKTLQAVVAGLGLTVIEWGLAIPDIDELLGDELKCRGLVGQIS